MKHFIPQRRLTGSIIVCAYTAQCAVQVNVSHQELTSVAADKSVVKVAWLGGLPSVLTRVNIFKVFVVFAAVAFAGAIMEGVPQLESSGRFLY